MYYILYSYNKENVGKKIVRKIHLQYYILSMLKFMSSVYKISHLSVPTSILSYDTKHCWLLYITDTKYKKIKR